MIANDVIKDLKTIANPEKAKIFLRFFKTDKGQYGEGDKFWGITVPAQRLVAKKYIALSLLEIKKLLQNKIHEVRLTGAMILVYQAEKASIAQKKILYKFYLANTVGINNWDIVDCSARVMVGEYLVNNPKEVSILNKLAISKNLWEKRIAVIASWAFIRRGQFEITFNLAKKLMNDPHDLMHKAIGWMLREIGKKDQEALERFLDVYTTKLPRTALRYAIERFEDKKRRQYLILK